MNLDSDPPKGPLVAGHADAGRIKLAIALGNPGARYASTRHNAGMWLAEALASARGWSFARVSDIDATAAGTASDLRLARVDEFMNRSGAPVQRLLHFLKIVPECTMILHDEADIPAGSARIKFGGGLAGHNGLRDIDSRLGTRRFWRLRIGVGAAGAGDGREGQRANEELSSFVLKKPSTAERELVDASIRRVVDCWGKIESGQMDEAIRRLHTQEKRATQGQQEEPEAQGKESG